MKLNNVLSEQIHEKNTQQRRWYSRASTFRYMLQYSMLHVSMGLDTLVKALSVDT